MVILMSICLLAEPARCREERLSFSFEPTSPTGCVARSQGAMAEWQLGHPRWRIVRWRCVARGRIGDDI